MSSISKGLNEAYGRYDRRDAYQRDYDSSVSGMGKRQSYAYRMDGGANDEGWDDEPQRSYQPKPVAKKGYYFYNVPAGQDDKAKDAGLFITKSGKWYSPFQNPRADMFFGKPKFWQPNNESKQLDELSPETLASYKKKAGADASAADKQGDYERGNKRFSGIVRATKKELDNDLKGIKEDEIDEGLSLHDVAWIGNLVPSFIQRITSAGTREAKQTLQLGKILAKWTAGNQLTPAEEDFAKQQLIDIAKMIASLAIASVPLGSASAHAATGVAAGVEHLASHGAKDLALDALAVMLSKNFKFDFLKKIVHNLETDSGKAFSHIEKKQSQAPEDEVDKRVNQQFQQAKMGFGGMSEGVAEDANDKPEAGDKIVWYHSNHYPNLEGEVVGWKDGHLIVKSIDPSPRNTEQTVATYRVPKNNILSVEKQGVAEESEKNPHTSALGRALYRDLSKEKKASPQQVQRNKERWAQRQAERNKEQPVKESKSSILEGVQQVDEGWKEKLGAAALAGSMALGAAGANARVVPGQDDPGINRLNGKPIATQQASDTAPAKAEAPKGFSIEYLQKAANPDRVGRFLISVERAQELLSQAQGN